MERNNCEENVAIAPHVALHLVLSTFLDVSEPWVYSNAVGLYHLLNEAVIM